ncbi:cell division protein FtsX [Fervidicella metallireducens AeB]|uniref:Cell division protein FtsX n=1 Tax=Fervidicella metallireducens AeB TaxID=1403537 RepID=A0A017RY20_9CLOT|nr:permease-like cell division protein FtsX [Fervidicella metallireducens]EYE88845.1 cell division protein FtsX [Fervidicella metallireducens AeB]
MKIKTFKYFFKESISNIIKNRVMSFASITTVAAALFVLGIFMLLVANVNKMVTSVEDKVEIKAFLNDDVTTLKQNEIESEIKKIPAVKSIVFESKEDALEKFKNQLGENKDLANGLDLKNPLPASFIIKVDKVENVADTSNKIAKMEGIYKVKDGRDILDKVIRVINFIKASSLALIVILGAVGIFLISNTIRLTVYARKKEIGIMKYIGATDWFIRWPFLFEGMFLGLFGAIISILLLKFGYSYVVKVVATDVVIFSLIPAEYIINTLAWQFSIVGIVIGGLGSLISLRRFLVL